MRSAHRRLVRLVAFAIYLALNTAEAADVVAPTTAEDRARVIYEMNFDSRQEQVHPLNSGSLRQGAGRDGSAAFVGLSTSAVSTAGQIGIFGPIPFQSGRDYRISVWVKGEEEGLEVWVYYYPSDGASLRFKTTTEWREQSATISLPPEAYERALAMKLKPGEGQVRFFTGHTTSSGKLVYFDDLRIELLPPCLRAEYKSVSAEEKIVVSVVTAGFEELEGIHGREELRLAVSIWPVDGKEPMASQQVTPDAVSTAVSLSTKNLPAGKYIIRSTLSTSQGRALGSIENPLEVIRF